jgi:hypothetical protein
MKSASLCRLEAWTSRVPQHGARFVCVCVGGGGGGGRRATEGLLIIQKVGTLAPLVEGMDGT